MELPDATISKIATSTANPNDPTRASDALMKQNMALVHKLATRTHFTENEVISLLHMHTRMISHGPLDLARFREVIHACFDIFDEMMLDRIFRSFDKDYNGFVSAIEWVEGCSVLIRGTPQELIEYSYFIYDIDGDGSIVREELQRYLKKSIFQVQNITLAEELEEGEKDIIDLAMKKLDKDRDGLITFQDYEKACYKDPLLVQALGQCVPSPKSCAAFLACFTEQYRNYTTVPIHQIKKYAMHWRRGIDYHLGPQSKNQGRPSFPGNNVGSKKASVGSGSSGSGGTEIKPGARRASEYSEVRHQRSSIVSGQARMADRMMKIIENKNKRKRNPIGQIVKEKERGSK